VPNCYLYNAVFTLVLLYFDALTTILCYREFCRLFFSQFFIVLFGYPLSCLYMIKFQWSWITVSALWCKYSVTVSICVFLQSSITDYKPIDINFVRHSSSSIFERLPTFSRLKPSYYHDVTKNIFYINSDYVVIYLSLHKHIMTTWLHSITTVVYITEIVALAYE